MKRCNRCEQMKPPAEFYEDSRSKAEPKGLMPACKECVRARNRASAAKDPKKAVARSTAWREKNPGRASAISRAWQLRHPEQYKVQVYRNRFKIDFATQWNIQAGLCACCGKPMLREGKDPMSVVTNHDRTCCPGKKSCGRCVRGLIHRNCNLVLGYAKDDIEVLQAAALYLERWERERRFSVDNPSGVNSTAQGS